MKTALMICPLLFTCVCAFAGEVEDAIADSQKAYQQHKLSEAANQLAYATGLIRQQQGDKLKTLLPDPLEGWQAEAAESEQSQAVMVTGVTSSRYYHKGEQELTIKVVMDSPLIQAMAGLYSTPNMAVMSGFKVKKVNGITALFKEKGEPRLSMMKGNTLVQITCNDCQEDELLAYAKAIDLVAISQL
ncbi:hypothetical protein [Gallaecimonas mangrovi]|uniref:hypothetical protein n=1 Tax=Gallaecimonas mangrovi TaxID=2291597 RepID=UPI000E206E7E|nr:hypothetical protein [Gallaecimonas mangrovi]